MTRRRRTALDPFDTGDDLETLRDIAGLIQLARGSATRAVNAVMTATYWMVGRRIVEQEQRGEERADYGEALIDRLAADLGARFGRGFGKSNLFEMRSFYQAYSDCFQELPGRSAQPLPAPRILQTASGESSAAKATSSLSALADVFPLSWSHYVLLVRRSRSPDARRFYEAEALRGGWTVRQLARQIDAQFYERTALSRDKAAMLRKGGLAEPEDRVLPEQEIKDPLVLEFLGLKDEYSESDLEEALIYHLESFLLELGGDFCFVGRQRRLRVGDEWYRVDLVFFHRRLRCMVIIDLKLGKFTHADAGQMHLYLNYAREHWVREGENPPVGIILCAHKDEAVARYAIEGLPSKVLAAEYRTALPGEQELAAEIERTRALLMQRRLLQPGRSSAHRERKRSRSTPP